MVGLQRQVPLLLAALALAVSSAIFARAAEVEVEVEVEVDEGARTRMEPVERDPNRLYSEEENFRFINEVLAKLNNNERCTLPSWDEIDEVQRSYAQLEAALGGAEQLRNKLDQDQRLLQDTLLDQWTFFQQRMQAGVVLRSSKKRSFLGKVERYQEAKYKSSVCTRQANNAEVTNQIFIKNPIVRYVAHMQSRRRYVPEFPVEPEPEPESAAESESELESGAGAKAEELTDEPREDAKNENELAPEHTPAPAPGSSQADKTKIIEVPIPDGQLKLKIEYVPIETDENHDPLTDIPAPSADDKNSDSTLETSTESEAATLAEPELATTSTPEPEPASVTTAELEPETATTGKSEPPVSTSEPEPEVASTTTEPTRYDPNAPELVELEVDSLDLAKLDKPEPKEWDFDYENGELKWPDELPPVKFDESYDLVLRDWSKFLENPQLCARADGSLYDCNKDRRNLKSRPGAEQRRRQFTQSVKVYMEDKHVEDILGWHPDRWDPETERRVRVPVGQRAPPKVRSDNHHHNDDGWNRFYSGRFCRLDFNKNNFKDSRGVRAVKTLFGKDDYSKKKRMLERQRSDL